MTIKTVFGSRAQNYVDQQVVDLFFKQNWFTLKDVYEDENHTVYYPYIKEI